MTTYQHEQNKTLTIVLLNRSHDNATANISLKIPLAVSACEVYRSSEKEDCIKLDNLPVKDGKLMLTMPPRSMVTLFGSANKP